MMMWKRKLHLQVVRIECRFVGRRRRSRRGGGGGGMRRGWEEEEGGSSECTTGVDGRCLEEVDVWRRLMHPAYANPYDSADIKYSSVLESLPLQGSTGLLSQRAWVSTRKSSTIGLAV